MVWDYKIIELRTIKRWFVSVYDIKLHALKIHELAFRWSMGAFPVGACGHLELNF